MSVPLDHATAGRPTDGLTLLDFLLPETADTHAAVELEATDGLAMFFRSLDEGRAHGQVETADAPAEIDAAVLADRLFPHERLPSLVTGPAPAIARIDDALPVVLTRPEPVEVRKEFAPGWLRIVALVFVASGVALFAYAQGMRDRDRRTTVTAEAQKRRTPPVTVDVVATRLQDATTAAALTPIRGATFEPLPDSERITHDPAVPVARILAVAERFVSEGDILAARAMLDDLVGRDDPHGLFAMAETFDPNMLAAWNLPRAEANSERAKALYDKALKRGQVDAAGRLAALAKQ